MLINACKYYQIPNHTDKHKGILMNKLKNSPTYLSISNLNYLVLTKNCVHTYSWTILFRHPNSMASLKYINTIPTLTSTTANCITLQFPTQPHSKTVRPLPTATSKSTSRLYTKCYRTIPHPSRLTSIRWCLSCIYRRRLAISLYPSECLNVIYDQMHEHRHLLLLNHYTPTPHNHQPQFPKIWAINLPTNDWYSSGSGIQPYYGKYIHVRFPS